MLWTRLFRRARRVTDPGAGPPMRSDFARRDRRGDAFVECYVEWREECEALESAYRRWAGSICSERDLAFATYSAALDREERAAFVFGVVAARMRAHECL